MQHAGYINCDSTVCDFFKIVKREEKTEEVILTLSFLQQIMLYSWYVFEKGFRYF